MIDSSDVKLLGLIELHQTGGNKGECLIANSLNPDIQLPSDSEWGDKARVIISAAIMLTI